jgi:hypothetical protein
MYRQPVSAAHLAPQQLGVGRAQQRCHGGQAVRQQPRLLLHQVAAQGEPSAKAGAAATQRAVCTTGPHIALPQPVGSKESTAGLIRAGGKCSKGSAIAWGRASGCNACVSGWARGTALATPGCTCQVAAASHAWQSRGTECAAADQVLLSMCMRRTHLRSSWGMEGARVTASTCAVSLSSGLRHACRWAHHTGSICMWYGCLHSSHTSARLCRPCCLRVCCQSYRHLQPTEISWVRARSMESWP